MRAMPCAGSGGRPSVGDPATQDACAACGAAARAGARVASDRADRQCALGAVRARLRRRAGRPPRRSSVALRANAASASRPAFAQQRQHAMAQEVAVERASGIATDPRSSAAHALARSASSAARGRSSSGRHKPAARERAPRRASRASPSAPGRAQRAQQEGLGLVVAMVREREHLARRPAPLRRRRGARARAARFEAAARASDRPATRASRSGIAERSQQSLGNAPPRHRRRRCRPWCTWIARRPRSRWRAAPRARAAARWNPGRR